MRLWPACFLVLVATTAGNAAVPKFPGIADIARVPGDLQRHSIKTALDVFLRSADARQRVSTKSKLGQGLEFLGNGFNELLKARPDPTWALRALVPQNNVNEALMKLLETVRTIVKLALEPLELDCVRLDRHDALAEMTGYVKDVQIKRLSEFEVESLDSSLERLIIKLNLSFDKLDAFGEYDLDARASGQLHVYGNGTFRVRAYELKLDAKLALGYQNEHFVVNDLTIYVSMSQLKVVLENFLGGGRVGETVSNIIGDVGPAYLDEYKEDISKFMSNLLTDTINSALAGFTLNDIIDWISGAKPPPSLSPHPKPPSNECTPRQ